METKLKCQNELLQLGQLQLELQRMNAENQRLRDMLSQVTNNYGDLQMRFVGLMQQQQQQQSHVDETAQQNHYKVSNKYFLYLCIIDLKSIMENLKF